MSLLNGYDLSKSFGADDIFSGVTVSIPHRGRIGLVGANGIGKTTLLRILAGLDEASSGQVTRARNLRLGYLPQNATMSSTTQTLWEACLEPFGDLLARQAELGRLEQDMSNPQRAEEAIEVYGKRQAEFEHLGGYTFEIRMRQTLQGLGFDETDIHRPMQHLSGGQRTRAYLARLLLSDPDLLLLDEPTNHLDIGSVEWLEAYLSDWHGAALIVSHDRYFLNAVANTIWEMTPQMEEYRGNYSAYLVQREERYNRRLEEYQDQQEFIEKEEEYIRRNIAGQNTRQAQGRRRRLERLLEEARLTPPIRSRKLRFNLKPVGRSGDLVLRTRDLSVGYADEGRALFVVPDLVLQRGECAALIGPNGAGKTTFLKTILEQIPPFAGEALLGASLKVGYFAQAHEDLHPDWTLMEEIETASNGMLPAAVRDYLGKFLFSGDDVFKQVKTLSGGERGRLALACLALSSANLLLLDEPTNHLDLPSQEILQAILAEFGGTILLVSHDRYLIDALATQVWEIFPDESRMRVYDGSYSEYRTALQAEAARTAANATPPAEVSKPKTNEPAPPAALSKDQQRRREQQRQVLEKEIYTLEDRLDSLSRQLEVPPPDALKVQQMGQEYQDLQKQLEEKLEEWTAG